MNEVYFLFIYVIVYLPKKSPQLLQSLISDCSLVFTIITVWNGMAVMYNYNSTLFNTGNKTNNNCKVQYIATHS